MDAETDDADISVRDERGQLLPDQNVECLSCLFLQRKVLRQLRRVASKVMAAKWLEALRNGIGVSYRSQSFESVEVIDEDWDRLRPVLAEMVGELEEQTGLREDKLEVLLGEELLGSCLQRICCVPRVPLIRRCGEIKVLWIVFVNGFILVGFLTESLFLQRSERRLRDGGRCCLVRAVGVLRGAGRHLHCRTDDRVGVGVGNRWKKNDGGVPVGVVGQVFFAGRVMSELVLVLVVRLNISNRKRSP